MVQGSEDGGVVDALLLRNEPLLAAAPAVARSARVCIFSRVYA